MIEKTSLKPTALYLHAHHQQLSPPQNEKQLRQALKQYGVDARRLSRFTMLALLGVLPLRSRITAGMPLYLASSFNSPDKFNKMFTQLTEHNLPSPLDFMANISNAAAFWTAKTLGIDAPSVFLVIDENSIVHPLLLALNDLSLDPQQTALVGWAFEHYRAGQTEGSLWWLVNGQAENAMAEIVIDMQKPPSNRPHFLSYLAALTAGVGTNKKIVL